MHRDEGQVNLVENSATFSPEFKQLSAPIQVSQFTTDSTALSLGLQPKCGRIALFDFDGTIVREPATQVQLDRDLTEARWSDCVNLFKEKQAAQVIVSTGRSCAEGRYIGEQLHKKSGPPWLVICENGGAAVACDANYNLTTIILDSKFKEIKDDLRAKLQEFSTGEPLLCSSLIAENRLTPEQQGKFEFASRKLNAEPMALQAAAERYASMFFLTPTEDQWGKVENTAKSFGLWATADMPNLHIPHLWGAETRKEQAASTLLQIINGDLRQIVAAGNSLSNDAGMLDLVHSLGGQTFFIGEKNQPPAYAKHLSSPRELPKAFWQLLVETKN